MRNTRWSSFVLVAFAMTAGAQIACLAQAPRQTIELRWIPDSTDTAKFVVEVSGIARAKLNHLEQQNRLPDLLRVYVQQGRSGDSSVLSDLPSMLGEYAVTSSALRFTPMFALSPGVNYLAIVKPEVLGDNCGSCPPITSRLEVPASRLESTTVATQVFPSGNVLPENLLKFYIHFSSPMSRGRVYEHIHLKDGQGRIVELPFLELDEELWDAGMVRLTLIIDPGRIKRGVKPLEDIGPALEEGKKYALAVDRTMQDSTGATLKSPFEKIFTIGPADRTPPDPGQWKIESPGARSRDPLSVSFGESLDHAITQRVIHVTFGAGASLAGIATLGSEERSWQFVPEVPWLPGNYNLVIEKTLEDLAGNNIGKPFDVDLFEGIKRKRVTGTFKLSFIIK